MNKKLGLVGCGYWGPNIVRNIQKTQNMSLQFVVDQNEEVIKKLQQKVMELLLLSLRKPLTQKMEHEKTLVHLFIQLLSEKMIKM